VADLPIVEVGPVAHGGHCVARLDGQVVFVRHTLPGERVRIRVTEESKRFLRADAVEVIEAAPGHVTPPCPYAGTCGGCDFQHVDPAVQRELLGDVVREQLSRLAGITWDGEVERVGDELGWRTRMTFAVDADGRAGLRKHRSHDVVPIERCLIAHPDLPDVLGRRWEPGSSVEAVVSSRGEQLVVGEGKRTAVTEDVHGMSFRVGGSGFWQVHPAAAETLVDAVMAGAGVEPGDRVVDLYAGVGLFTAFLAEAAGPGGEVVSVEADPGGSRDARRNLHDRPTVRLVGETVERAFRSGQIGERADVVVLDPPRTGAKRAVHDIAGLGARRVVYVACDPAALARDLATFAESGYRLDSLRAFALFPMTHHVECVAVLSASE
jgi:tRNA/tmRNA/rRNA uracil-C5-methylase (TrmA/RlmC/RlmD family)